MAARAVLDPNVLVSGAISSRGAPREILELWLAGDFEMIVSHELLYELQAVLMGRKLRGRLAYPDVIRYIAYLAEHAKLAEQSEVLISEHEVDDEDDFYLLALAQAQGAFLVSGDQHLAPVAISPREFVEKVRKGQ